MISVHKMPNDFCSYPNSNKCMMHKDISKWVVYFYAAAGPILALMVAAILPVGTNQGSILELFQDALKDGVLVFSVYCGISLIFIVTTFVGTIHQKFLSANHYFWYSFTLPVTAFRLIQIIIESN